MDIKTAFLNGNIEEELYMIQPEGFVDPKDANKSNSSRPPIRATCKSRMQVGMEGVCSFGRHRTEQNRKFLKIQCTPDFLAFACLHEHCIHFT
jgi:hypothetical protein